MLSLPAIVRSEILYTGKFRFLTDHASSSLYFSISFAQVHSCISDSPRSNLSMDAKCIFIHKPNISVVTVSSITERKNNIAF